MKRWLAAAAIAATSVAVSQAWAAGGVIESRYTRLTHCRMIFQSEYPETVAYRCHGIGAQHVWRRYLEGTRMALGFGPRRNESGFSYAAERDNRWPIEWRGHAGRRFKPFAAIVRVLSQGAPGSTLVVYRLRGDGTSCVIGDVSGAGENARAEAMADASLSGFECLSEPSLAGRGSRDPASASVLSDADLIEGDRP